MVIPRRHPIVIPKRHSIVIPKTPNNDNYFLTFISSPPPRNVIPPNFLSLYYIVRQRHFSNNSFNLKRNFLDSPLALTNPKKFFY